MIESILGWLGNIGFVYGVYALGRKQVIGFYSCIVGNLFYVIQSYMMGNHSLLCLSILLIILNAKGIWEWTSQKRILKQGYRRVRAKSKSKVSRKQARDSAQLSKNIPHDRSYDISEALKKEWKRLLKEKKDISLYPKVINKECENVKSNCRCGKNKCN